MTNVPSWLRAFFGEGNLLSLEKLLTDGPRAYPEEQKMPCYLWWIAHEMANGPLFCRGVTAKTGFSLRWRKMSALC